MKRVMYLIIEDQPNKDGKQHFWLQWVADNVSEKCNEVGLRGQYFFAVLSEHIDLLTKKGWTIEEKKELQNYLDLSK